MSESPHAKIAARRRSTGPALKVGIGITTYNRAEMLRGTIEAVRQFTRTPCELFVADDGSTDQTSEVLATLKVSHISASNRGIAWNKNRALYYLVNVACCDIIILLEDDTFPNAAGWEESWIHAGVRFGHINLAPSHWDEQYPIGDGSPGDPFVSKLLTGQCSVFSRQALTTVGFMDTRFRRYGFEHVEHTFRLISCGYGGLASGEPGRFLPYLIRSDLTVAGLDKGPDMGGVYHNAPIFDKLKYEDRHRWAWRNDEELAIFRSELASLIPVDSELAVQRVNDDGPDWILKTFDSTPVMVNTNTAKPSVVSEFDGGEQLIARIRGREACLGIRQVAGIVWLVVESPHEFSYHSSVDAASVFDFVSAPDVGFGLRYDGLFICCDVSQGRLLNVTRPRISDWETFRFGGYSLPAAPGGF